jgi:hypothetical protein
MNEEAIARLPTNVAFCVVLSVNAVVLLDCNVNAVDAPAFIVGMTAVPETVGLVRVGVAIVGLVAKTLAVPAVPVEDVDPVPPLATPRTVWP